MNKKTRKQSHAYMCTHVHACAHLIAGRVHASLDRITEPQRIPCAIGTLGSRGWDPSRSQEPMSVLAAHAEMNYSSCA